MAGPTRDWTDYRPWLQAILDEYARTITDLGRVVSAVPSDDYLKSTDLSDDEFPAMREIMWHVIGAAHGYANYLEDAITGTDHGSRRPDYAFSEPSKAIDSLWIAFDRMVEVLSLIKDTPDTDAGLAAITFKTRWGQTYDIEQMLEHAIVHILRHRRQIERWCAVVSA